MSDVVISVSNVSKAYRIWAAPAARLTAPAMERLADLLPPRPAAGLRARAKKRYRDFWALKNISFEMRKGEAVGIVGRNGSGKSTLLQIIAGTMQPTEGSVKVNGRVAALLELGSGFNPEFTGRENVYLNASVLGLTRTETDTRFGAIATFADIGDFIDQPVRTYSSGMMVRLAFAVQIQIRPDILIVDEALAVGDEPFQRKCFSQIALMQQKGVTILFVSHAAATVVELCQRALLLDHGQRLLTAPPKVVIQNYHQLCYALPDARERVREEIVRLDSAAMSATVAVPTIASSPKAGKPSEAYFLESMAPASRSEFPARGATIGSPQILDTAFRPMNVLVRGCDYLLRWRVHFDQAARRVRFGWVVKTISGIAISGAATHVEGDGFEGFDSGQTVEATFRFKCLFNHGAYFIDLGVRAQIESPDILIHGISDALMFKVQPTPQAQRNGYVDCSIEPVWSINVEPAS